MRSPRRHTAEGVLPLLLVVAAALAPATGARCAQVSVEASVDRTSLSTSDTLTLTITVTLMGSGVMPQPKLPDLAAFSIVGSSVRQSISLGAGGGTSTATHEYTLRPQRTGRFTIGPTTVAHGGRTYRTRPITVTVTRGAAPPSPPTPQPPAGAGPLAPSPVQPRPEQAEEAVFVQADVDRRRVYVNQQITWTFSIFRGTRDAEVGAYTGPTTTDFWAEDLPAVEPTQRLIGGKAYAVEQIKLALFPTRPGKLTVGPASVTCSYGFLGPTRRLSTEAITVTVLPLPSERKPATFQGTVGKWELSGSTDRTRAAVGDAITYTVDVTGTGNVHTVSRPVVRSASGMRLYDSTAEQNADTSSGTVKGSARFEYLVIGMRAGDYEIGPAELAYLDPAIGAYRVARTQPVRVSFGRGAASPASVAPGATDEARMAALQEALCDIKPAGDSGVGAEAPVYTRGTFWALQAIPLLAVALAFVYGRWQRRLATDGSLARRTRAARRPRQALARLRERLDPEQAGDFYGGLHQAMCGYIADKLDVSTTSVSSGSVGELVRHAGAGEDGAAQTAECLRRCEFGRFAPAESTRQQRERDLEQAIALLSRLEGERLGDA